MEPLPSTSGLNSSGSTSRSDLTNQDVVIISDDEDSPIVLVSNQSRHSVDYNGQVREIVYVVKQNQQRCMDPLLNRIDAVLQSYDGEFDLAGLSFTRWDAETPEQVVIGMRRKMYLSFSHLKNVVEQVKRDRERFFCCNTFAVKLKIVARDRELVEREIVEDSQEFNLRCRLKKSILTVQLGPTAIDNLTRAIVIGQAYAKRNEQISFYKNVRSPSQHHLLHHSNELRTLAEIREDDDLVSAFQRLDRYLRNDFTMSVFHGLGGREVMLESLAPPLSGRPTLDIVTDLREFHVVTSVEVAFSTAQCKNYCRACRVSYRVRSDHDCLVCCSHCRRVGVCVQGNIRKCGNCNRRFASDLCFLRHQEENRERSDKKSTCSLLKKCRDCRKMYHTEGKRKKHSCDTTFCEKCNADRPLNHSCGFTVIKQEEERNVSVGTIVESGEDPVPVPDNVLSSNVSVSHTPDGSSATRVHIPGTSLNGNVAVPSVESGNLNNTIRAGNYPGTPLTNREQDVKDVPVELALSDVGGCSTTQPANQRQRSAQHAWTPMDVDHSLPEASATGQCSLHTPVAAGSTSAVSSPRASFIISNMDISLPGTSTTHADVRRSSQETPIGAATPTPRVLGGEAATANELHVSPAAPASDQPIPVHGVFNPNTKMLELRIPWP